MFITKILTKMAPHGLTFGEHCVDEEENETMSNLLKKQIYSEHQLNVYEKCGLGIFTSPSLFIMTH